MRETLEEADRWLSTFWRRWWVAFVGFVVVNPVLRVAWDLPFEIRAWRHGLVMLTGGAFLLGYGVRRGVERKGE